MDYTPFIITLKLAILTTAVLLFVCIPLAYLIVFKKWKGKVIVESLFLLPIVLPPTVLGFYFLVLFGKNSTIGSFLNDHLNIDLVFSFNGIFLASILFCLPFMITPIIAGFRAIPQNVVESVILLKKSSFKAIRMIYIPYAKKSIFAGVLLTMAHTIGEFGVVLMIGGKLEETRVASVAIYDEMNRGNYEAAHLYSIILLVASFLVILILHFIFKPFASRVKY